MIIDAKTVVITLVLVGIALYLGLKLIRQFALQIAQENHDTNMAIDQAEEEQRLKRQRDADTAAATAFAKVEPLLSKVQQIAKPTATVPKGSITVTPVTSKPGTPTPDSDPAIV